jgi:hypothetical protein
MALCQCLAVPTEEEVDKILEKADDISRKDLAGKTASKYRATEGHRKRKSTKQ